MHGEKRGITREEHQQIIARETNPERRDYYELLWHTGSSQTDVANLHAEDINWEDGTIFYRRKRSGTEAMPRFGKKAAEVLRRLPKSGPLQVRRWLVHEREVRRIHEEPDQVEPGLFAAAEHLRRFVNVVLTKHE